ncbi:PREDICTED: F-box/kelch-repeat protein At3g27150-like [Nelumbo nucifera]|uniref:F-box/kelch-repeat protein At3g27150-like n=1 Tax=Nelumbo nucifera TaxID=4432 RepID=A0A1U7ZDB6_NELNU|nr:PREDICTED: F-box/kelch-repeat protein At3g27150-like [Nelumbo nucifera]XP_010250756.1 PREDICTED: F-box/kelch-repeat protein At3g27150-like [Nelumbo nucifera]
MSKGEEEERSHRRENNPRSKKGAVDEGTGNGSWVSSRNSPSKKTRVSESLQSFDESWDGFSLNEVGDVVGSSDVEPQDADYSYVPSLSDELALLILARVPRSEYWKFCFVNKRYSTLLSSGDLYKIRREIGIKEPSVFMLAGGELCWWAFDRKFTSCRKLPALPSDPCFAAGDKESLCAGTHLLVSGKEIQGVAIWRYDLIMNRWFRGPSMISPRCLFASASCGNVAYVAGGIGMGNRMEILNSAEKYDPENESWVPLPRMHQRRKMCSGCYMDNKFYVIGGQNERGIDLTCGEFYDADRNAWELVPDMLKDAPVSTSRSPPLVAVVNNELYSLEASSNHLKLYLKKSNSWKDLGMVPVRADQSRGWGIAFKSLGDELLVIGGSATSYAGHGMTIFICSPDPNAMDLEWRCLSTGGKRMSHFVLNCSVMVA